MVLRPAMCFAIFVALVTCVSLANKAIAVCDTHRGGVDSDGDGVCSIASGGTDCDDTDGRRFPGNAEVCDAEHYDEDCNPFTFGNRDADGDGYVDQRCCNTLPWGGLTCGLDCDDAISFVHPRQVEVCNHIDDNCDGWIDDVYGIGRYFQSYRDADGDGYGAGPNLYTGRADTHLCPGDPQYSSLGNDCNDANPNIYVGVMACLSNPADTIICGSDGRGIKSSCSPGSVCISQPNGTGVCIPKPQ